LTIFIRKRMLRVKVLQLKVYTLCPLYTHILFFRLHNSKYYIHPFFFLTSSLHKQTFITAHFVHHCKLKQALLSGRVDLCGFIVGLDASNHHYGCSQPSTILQSVGNKWEPRKSIRAIDTSKTRIIAIAEPPCCAVRYCTGSGKSLVVVTIVAWEIHTILLFQSTKGDVGERVPSVSRVSRHMKSVPYGLWIESKTIVFGVIPESACICLNLSTFWNVKRVMDILCYSLRWVWIAKMHQLEMLKC